jgi:ribosomal protein L32
MTAPLPVRDGSRDDSALTNQPRSCPICTAPLTSSRARYCSAACKQHAFRLRHQAQLARDDRRLRDDLRRRDRLVAHTLYECPRCGERRLGERRCPECHVFCRALGLGGHCPECEQPILLADLLGTVLLGTEVMR